jgi:hypothetical protein
MGHATQIYAVRWVLQQLYTQALTPAADDRAAAAFVEQLQRLAYRMSENRIVAGLHFPLDLVGGAVLGTVIGRCALSLFDGSALPAVVAPCTPGIDSAAGAVELEQELHRLLADAPAVAVAAGMPPRSAILAEMWRLACKELNDIAGPLPVPAAAAAAAA